MTLCWDRVKASRRMSVFGTQGRPRVLSLLGHSEGLTPNWCSSSGPGYTHYYSQLLLCRGAELVPDVDNKRDGVVVVAVARWQR